MYFGEADKKKIYVRNYKSTIAVNMCERLTRNIIPPFRFGTRTVLFQNYNKYSHTCKFKKFIYLRLGIQLLMQDKA